MTEVFESSRLIEIEDNEITCLADPERVIERKVLQWSPYCGTYGDGGPGFFGILLEKQGEYPQEWLILRLWGADNWLEMDGRMIETPPNDAVNEPLYVNTLGKEKRDEVTPRLVNKEIVGFEVEDKSMVLKIGDSEIRINENSTMQLSYANGEQRRLGVNDSLKDAWVIAPVPWIKIQ